MKSQKIIIYLVCIVLFIILIKNVSFFENFQNYTAETPLTNHNVDMPINTYYSCKNMCGPNAKCSITGEQCTSDIDCYGCQPIVPTPPADTTPEVVGDNDAGKLIYNQNPRYSVLTTDIGTRARIYNKKLARVPKPYLGVNTWIKSANYSLKNQQDEYSYKYSTDPSKYKYTPHYPQRESVTGLFIENGPLAANAYL